MEKVLVKKQSKIEILSSLFFFSFSDKVKFAIKVSLSMVLAYLIPLSQGWTQASTAGMTIMLIAAMGSLSESVMKGLMRVFGTMIGAIIGMTLIAIFPQDRVLYLLLLSVAVSISLYLVRAYKGDPSIFMLTAMTMMMVFKNGEVDSVFLFGLEKTYMTIFGIMIYTLVGVFLWPVNVEDKSTDNAKRLSEIQKELFLQRDASKEDREQVLEKLIENTSLLEKSTTDSSTVSINLEQWHSTLHTYQKINATLTLLALHEKENYVDSFGNYVTNYVRLKREISGLFQAIANAWESQEKIEIPKALVPKYNTQSIEALPHLQRASLITTTREMRNLHDALRTLAEKLNRIHSTVPTFFEAENIPKNRRFLWGDSEHFKGVLVSFIIFWVAVYFWITMNPPGGFMVVALATGLSVLTTFTPVKPSLFIIVFSFSFIISICVYVFVLPHLHYDWELGIFIFTYTFIAFYFFNTELAIAFLLGFFTLNISNTMYYDFAIYLLILLMFYIYLSIMNLMYYIPFSTKPEKLFLQMKARMFRLSHAMIEQGKREQEGRASFFLKVVSAYGHLHLMSTVKKMQLWASQVDEKYFEGIDKKKLLAFTQVSEKFAYLVDILYDNDMISKQNSLLKIVRNKYDLPYFSDLLLPYAEGKEIKEIDAFWKSKDEVIGKVEDTLANILGEIDFEQYSKEDIAQLYESIYLRKYVWLALFDCQKIMAEIDFQTLKESRF